MTGDVSSVLAGLLARELDPAYRRRVQTVVSWLPPSREPTSHVVDIGCGRGYFVGCYARLGQRAITGIERDREAARRAALAHGARRGVSIMNADATALPLTSNSCTGAILSEVLEHVDDERTVLVEAFRVLRDDGVLAITVPHANFPWSWDPINRTLHTLGLPPVRRGPLAGIWEGHRRLYEIERLRSLVRDAGFVIEEERAFVRYCLPFSHNLIYGVGKRLVDAEMLPSGLASSIDRYGATDLAPSSLVRVLRAFLAFGDARNRDDEGFDVPTAHLAVKARKRMA